jgi:hypothetical protein
MMPLNLFNFLYNLAYFFLAAQGVFYLLCFSRVFGESEPVDFIRMRKKAAPILEPRLSVLYYSCLLLGVVTVVLQFRESVSLQSVFTLLSYLLLLTDVLLAKRYNIPANSMIELANVDTIGPAEAGVIQGLWIKWIVIRGRIMIAGFMLLLLQSLLFR